MRRNKRQIRKKEEKEDLRYLGQRKGNMGGGVSWSY